MAFNFDFYIPDFSLADDSTVWNGRVTYGINLGALKFTSNK